MVTLGAGTGQATFLSGLCGYRDLLDITAIVGVTDNGGHSGLLREQYGIPQVGDSRQCLIALSPPSQLRDDYSYRDDNGNSKGNSLLAAAVVNYGKLSVALGRAVKKLNTEGNVLPVTDKVVDVGAVLADGTRVVGEWQIIERKPRTPIVELYLEPKADSCIDSVLAIGAADFLVIAPGSLRTGIIPCLLTQGIGQAVRDTAAKIVLVVNLMTHPGQTDGFSVQDHLDEFAKYSGRYPDCTIINDGVVPEYLMEHYAKIGSEPVRGKVHIPAMEVIYGDFVPQNNNFRARQERVGDFKKWTHLLVHDSQKLAKTIISIIRGYST